MISIVELFSSQWSTSILFIKIQSLIKNGFSICQNIQRKWKFVWVKCLFKIEVMFSRQIGLTVIS